MTVNQWSADSEVFQDSQIGVSDLSTWINKHKSTVEGSASPSGDSKLSESEFRENLPSSIDKIIEREHNLESRPLSVRGDIKVRPEVIGYQGVHDWYGVTELFKEWLRGYDPDNSGAVVLEDSDGNQVEIPPRVRFGEERSKKEYARLHNLHQGLKDEWDNLHMTMLSLTTSHRNSRGGFRCPADHLEELTSSFDTVTSALDRALDVEYEYCWVLEPHPGDDRDGSGGYPHRHLVVFTKSEVEESDFHPVIDSHLRNTQGAKFEAHNYNAENPENRPITVKSVGAGEDEVNSIAFYLAEYIADSFQEPLDAPDHVQRFNALLWATCHRRVGYSQGCYEFMDRGYELHTGNEKRSPESDLKLLGMRDPDTGELHEIENEGASLDLVKPEAFAPHLTDPIGDPPPDDPEKGEDKTEP